MEKLNQEVSEDLEMPEHVRQKKAEHKKNLGNEALKSRDYKEAISYYTKALEYDDKSAPAYCNRALVYLKMKNYNQCMLDCNKALELKSDYLKAYHRRGKALFALNDFKGAYDDFKVIMEREPDNSEVNGDLKEA
jgi:small glutamine-rich tetratricopeptide repeat-containing protein alpha